MDKVIALQVGEKCIETKCDNRRFVRLGSGGSLPTIISKVGKDFLPIKKIVTRGDIPPYQPMNYTYLAESKFPPIFAIYRSLLDEQRPALIQFRFSRSSLKDSELCSPWERKKWWDKNKLVIGWEDLLSLTDKDLPGGGTYHPMGLLSTGIVINHIAHRCCRRIIVSDMFSDSDNDILSRILSIPDTEEKETKLWEYLAYWSFIDGYDGCTRRLLSQFWSIF